MGAHSRANPCKAAGAPFFSTPQSTFGRMNDVGRSSMAITRPSCAATAPSRVAAVVTLLMSAACSRAAVLRDDSGKSPLAAICHGPATTRAAAAKNRRDSSGRPLARQRRSAAASIAATVRPCAYSGFRPDRASPVTSRPSGKRRSRS